MDWNAVSGPAPMMKQSGGQDAGPSQPPSKEGPGLAEHYTAASNASLGATHSAQTCPLSLIVCSKAEARDERGFITPDLWRGNPFGEAAPARSSCRLGDRAGGLTSRRTE